MPLKHWLALSVLVLLVHLGLLQSLPLSLAPPGSAAAVALSFATRAVAPPPDAVPPPPSPVAKRPPKVAARPMAPPPPPEAAATQAPDPTPAAVLPTPAPENTAPPPLAEPEQAIPPQLAASAPEPLPALDAVASSAPAAPPAAMPLRFSAESLSPSIRLIYALKTNKFPFPVHGELLWLNEGNAYSARLHYGVFGLSREQTSRGLITTTGLAPERFSDKYRSELAAHFNYAEHKISFSANTPDAALLPGAQDRLSVLLQLGALLASEPEQYPPGSTVSIQTAGPRDADTWLFTVVSVEPLELTRGTTQAIKLERNPRRPYDQKVEVWLAPDLGYLPARIRITDANGDNVDQIWVATEPAGPPT
ncbi:MAG: hypothetical protein BWK72_13310 [Rhodoferax ferrireducens]|uniref:DUF3108 domain-containing protein n=1 Tax=Rhodoferax ferrireducens TaxID=192843 RepID=A0A1W9KT24_9BURK|nr:MAG: hypothetical protein BWK72_13310 [Rhodoferax ferrireducens]